MEKTRVVNKRLQVSTRKLDTLLELTQEINQNRTTAFLLDKFKDILVNQLNISRFCFFMFENQEWRCVISHNCNNHYINALNAIDIFSEIKDIHIISSFPKSYLSDFNIIISIIQRGQAVGYIAIGDINPLTLGVSPTIKHAKYIQLLGNIIFVAIDNKRLMKCSAKQASYTRELEFASEIQNMLIPNKETIPTIKDVDIGFYYHPHSQIGGDYFDVIQLNNNNIGFCIADVSGKGVAAALLMSNFQAALRAVFTKDITLKKLVHKLNDYVNLVAKGEKFITLFIARYDITNKQLEYINSGHVPPILYNSVDNSFKMLKKGCLGLGMNPTIPSIQKEQITVEKGFKLITFTDGLYEQESDKGVETNTNFIFESICNNKSITENIEFLTQQIEAGIEKGNFFDDVSILAMEFK